MTEIPMEILPENISEIAKSAKKLAEGEDSEVYRLGNKVLKRYPDLDLEQVERYRKATNAVAEILDGREIQTPFGKVKLTINPINKVIESAENFDVFTVSPHVEGDSVNEMLTSRLISQGEFNSFSGILEELSRSVMERVDFSGIHIIPWNVTLVEGEGMKEAAITDVCKRVDGLKGK